MNPKITPDHLARGAVVYVRQSTLTQVAENTESQRRQYALVEAARATGFASVQTIDDDLGRSGSGLMDRPGFHKLVALVCAGSIGAVYCIEASRLARNGRDWHHLIDLCALVGAIVVDGDGVYDPRLVNDRLLLGLKGTMSEYELSLLRQRGLAARDTKAKRGELRFTLPPGFCWSDAGRIEMDPDERVTGVIRLVLARFRELGSARQVFLWARQAGLAMPVVERNSVACRVVWKPSAYHTVLQVLQNPIYAGAYAFGRRGQRTTVKEGRARKTDGHSRPMSEWLVLLKDNHAGYISWAEFEENQRMIVEKRAHAEARGAQVGTRRPRAADRPDTVREMRTHDARLLRLAIGPCASLSMPRRRWSRRLRAVHRHRRQAGRPGCRRQGPGGRVGSRRRRGHRRCRAVRACRRRDQAGDRA